MSNSRYSLATKITLVIGGFLVGAEAVSLIPYFVDISFPHLSVPEKATLWVACPIGGAGAYKYSNIAHKKYKGY